MFPITIESASPYRFLPRDRKNVTHSYITARALSWDIVLVDFYDSTYGDRNKLVDSFLNISGAEWIKKVIKVDVKRAISLEAEVEWERQESIRRASEIKVIAEGMLAVVENQPQDFDDLREDFYVFVERHWKDKIGFSVNGKTIRDLAEIGLVAPDGILRETPYGGFTCDEEFWQFLFLSAEKESAKFRRDRKIFTDSFPILRSTLVSAICTFKQ